MPMTQEQLRELAKIGAEKRIAQLDRLIADARAEMDAIRTEFALKNGEPEDEPEEGMEKEELKSEIRRVLSAAHGVVMNSEAIVKAIEARKPIGPRGTQRVSRLCGHMPSVRRRDDGWIWN